MQEMSPVVGHRKEKVHSIGFDRFCCKAKLIERSGYYLAMLLSGWLYPGRDEVRSGDCIGGICGRLDRLSSIGSREEVFPRMIRTRDRGLEG